MNKKLFVLAGLAVAITAMFVVALISKKDSPESACKQFLAAIERGDGPGSYDMYTDRSKSLVKADKWNQQVAILKTAYGEQEPKLLGDSSALTDSSTGKKTGERQVYGIQYGDAKYKTTCTVTAADPGKIDSFTSQIGF